MHRPRCELAPRPQALATTSRCAATACQLSDYPVGNETNYRYGPIWGTPRWTRKIIEWSTEIHNAAIPRCRFRNFSDAIIDRCQHGCLLGEPLELCHKNVIPISAKACKLPPNGESGRGKQLARICCKLLILLFWRRFRQVFVRLAPRLRTRRSGARISQVSLVYAL